MRACHLQLYTPGTDQFTAALIQERPLAAKTTMVLKTKTAVIVMCVRAHLAGRVCVCVCVCVWTVACTQWAGLP